MLAAQVFFWLADMRGPARMLRQCAWSCCRTMILHTACWSRAPGFLHQRSSRSDGCCTALTLVPLSARQECMRAAGALLIKGSDPTSEDGQRLEKSQRELEKVCWLSHESAMSSAAAHILRFRCSKAEPHLGS